MTNITFEELTAEFITKYELYLRTKHKNKTNTINKDLKFIRKVFNDAIRQDIIGLEVSPFRKYKLRTEKTHRSHLSDEELTLIDKCNLMEGSKIALHRDMFIFASYAGGLRVSDVLKLQWKDFNGTHLNVVIKKTKTQLSIKVPDKALDIMNRYKKCTSRPTSFIFPTLPIYTSLDNPIELDRAISNATAEINKNLKIITKKRESIKIVAFIFQTLVCCEGIAKRCVN